MTKLYTLSSTKNQHLKVPRILIYIGKILQFFSVKWTTLYLSKLFTTPIKHKIPKRELQMDRNSIQTKIIVPEINKDIVVYQLGTGEKKILLVHGWSGRGTQLVKFADALIAKGYSTVSFDAPAHGNSEGVSTNALEYAEMIQKVNELYGPVTGYIAHSFGGIGLILFVPQPIFLVRLIFHGI